MTDWRDIVDMVETFSGVFHLRQSRPSVTEAADYPPVPAAINPTNGKRASSATTTSNASKSRKAEAQESDEAAEGYTGELGSPEDSSQGDGHQAGESAPLQWCDIWPQL
jgi:hypothetical protein